LRKNLPTVITAALVVVGLAFLLVAMHGGFSH
jgi:hypothetical protein